jgi:signal transduction histidine kinase
MTWHRQRRAREYLAFAALAAALGVIAVGGLLVSIAESGEAVRVGLSVKLTGAALAGGCAFEVAMHLASVRVARWRQLAWGATAVAVGVLSSGLGFDAGLQPEATWGFASAPDYPEPRLSILGHLALIILWLVAAAPLTLLIPGNRRTFPGTLFAATVMLSLTAGAHDICVLVLSLRNVYLLEHAGLVALVTMTYLFLRRFARTEASLSAQARELRREFDELLHARSERVRAGELAAVGALAGVIASELDGPLATIMATTRSITDTNADAHARNGALEKLDLHVDRLNQLTKDLVLHTRALKTQYAPVAIDELIATAIDRTVESAASARGIAIRVTGRAQGHIRGDRALLVHALSTVLTKVVGDLRDGSHLAVSIREVEDGRAWTFVTIEAARGAHHAALPVPAIDDRTELGLTIVDCMFRAHGGFLVRDPPLSIRLPHTAPTADP